jgi:hypothetical protein
MVETAKTNGLVTYNSGDAAVTGEDCLTTGERPYMS